MGMAGAGGGGKMKKDELVMVQWDDSASNSSWVFKEDAKPGLLSCRTVGFVLEDNKKHLSLYCTDCENGKISDQTCIPRSCVRKIQRMSLKRR